MRTKKKKDVDALEYFEKLKGPLSLSRAVIAFREADGISQAAFARKLGVGRSYLSNLENGRLLVSPSQAARIAKALRQPQDFFIKLALDDKLRSEGLRFTVSLNAA